MEWIAQTNLHKQKRHHLGDGAGIMDEQQQLENAIARIGQKSPAELLSRWSSLNPTESLVIRIVLKHAGPVLAELIGENAKLKKQLAERSPGGYADAPVQYGGDE